MPRPRLTVRVLAGLELIYGHCPLFRRPELWGELPRQDAHDVTAAQLWILAYRRWHNAKLLGRRPPTASPLFEPPPMS